jgi:hypothetical protein
MDRATEKDWKSLVRKHRLKHGEAFRKAVGLLRESLESEKPLA